MHPNERSLPNAQDTAKNERSIVTNILNYTSSWKPVQPSTPKGIRSCAVIYREERAGNKMAE